MRLRKNIIFAYAFILILGISVVTLSLDTPISSQIQFNIVSENKEPNDIPIVNAVCHAKTTSSLGEETSTGNFVFIRADNSPFLTDNPQFTLNDITDTETGKTLGAIGHFLKMRCTVGFDATSSTSGATFENQIACEDPDRQDECNAKNEKYVEVRPSSIEVQIFANDSNGVKERVYIGNHQIDNSVKLEDGNEETLLFVLIDIEDVLKNMDKGEYETLFEIRTSGILNMVLEDFTIDGTNLALIKYYVGSNDIPTYFDLKVTDNTIGEEPNTDPKCTSPKVYDEITKSCITPETESEEETKKNVVNQNTQEVGDNEQNVGDNEQDLGDDEEDKPFADIGADTTEFIFCGLSLDFNCLNDSKFTIQWMIVALFVMLILFAIVAKMFSGANPVR